MKDPTQFQLFYKYKKIIIYNNVQFTTVNEVYDIDIGEV